MDYSGAALAYLQEKYKGRFTEQDKDVATSAAIAEAVGSNPDRLGLLIVNFGANPVFLTLKPNPAANSGIELASGGGSVSMNVDEDYTLVTRQLFATSPAGASDLFVLEMIRELEA